MESEKFEGPQSLQQLLIKAVEDCFIGKCLVFGFKVCLSVLSFLYSFILNTTQPHLRLVWTVRLDCCSQMMNMEASGPLWSLKTQSSKNDVYSEFLCPTCELSQIQHKSLIITSAYFTVVCVGGVWNRKPWRVSCLKTLFKNSTSMGKVSVRRECVKHVYK